MWKIFNSIPRTFRHHFYGPRTSANIHSEEEWCDFAAKSDCVEDKHRCQEQQAAVGSPGTREQHRLCGNCGSKTRGQRQDWWRTCHSDFWSLFHGHHSTLEAVTWRTAVVLGLQLSRWDWWRQSRRQEQSPLRRHSLLYQVVLALPRFSRTTKHSILPAQTPANHGLQEQCSQDSSRVEATGDDQQQAGRRASADGESEDGFSDAFTQLQTLSKKAMAMERSLTGLHLAEMGDLEGATSQLEAASHLGHHPASFNLALCYHHGQGVERNIEKAVEYYQLAAGGGHAQAQYNLALLLLEGEWLGRDLCQGTQLLEQAAHQGLSQAQTYLGILYTEERLRDMDKAIALFQAAAAQNDPEGQFFLGICYEQGWGVEASDEEAVKWYGKAADQGHSQATYNVAVFTEYGLGGVTADMDVAWELYKQAADSGHEPALHRLQEVEAKAAVSLWTDETQPPDQGGKVEKDPESPRCSLSPSLSTPGLSDFVRKHLSELAVGELWFSPQRYAQPQSTSQQPLSAERCPVHFFLGEEEDRGASCQEYEVSTPEPMGGGASPTIRESYAGFPRNSTMPNLQIVTCL